MMEALQAAYCLDSSEPIALTGTDVVSVEKLSFRSKDVYNFLASTPDLQDSFVRAIIAGSIALQRAQSTIDSDFFDKRIEETLSRIHTDLTELIDPANKNSLGQKLQGVFRAQNDSLRSLFSSGQMATSELEKRITDFSKKLKEEVTLAIGAQMSDENGQLGVILRQLKNDLNNLRDTIIAERTAKVSSAPIIGEDLELECQHIMEEICAAYSLELTDLRAIPGPSGAKVGDYKIGSPNNGPRSFCKPVIVEVKNRSNRISLNAALKELSEACTNRDCEIGIFVASNGCIPPEASPMNFYGSRGRQIICDPMTFRIALRLAISRATIESQGAISDSDVDLPKAIELLQSIQSKASLLSTLQSSCSSIRRTATKAEQTAKELRDELEEKASAALTLLIPKSIGGHS